MLGYICFENRAKWFSFQYFYVSANEMKPSYHLLDIHSIKSVRYIKKGDREDKMCIKKWQKNNKKNW
jgi:hypothetical protein